jgi:hypothetical protein
MFINKDNNSIYAKIFISDTRFIVRNFSIILVTILFLNLFMPSSYAGTLEGTGCQSQGLKTIDKGVHYVCDFTQVGLSWWRDYNQSPVITGNKKPTVKAPKTSCSTLKSQILKKQGLVSSTAKNVNDYASRAQATYNSYWVSHYNDAYSSYTLGVVQMLVMANNQSICFSPDLVSELKTTLSDWTYRNNQTLYTTSTNVDPYSLRSVSYPKFYEWLYPNG